MTSIIEEYHFSDTVDAHGYIYFAKNIIVTVTSINTIMKFL